MSQPHVPTCPHLSPKPTPCPSPVAPSITLKVSFDPAGPLNPPHVPAPCPHLSPKPTPCPSPVVLPQMSHSTTLVPKTHPMSQPHAPTCPLVPKCYPKGLIPPCWSPKPIPCPSPVSHPMSQPRVPKCYKGLIPPCWSPKPTPCPNPIPHSPPKPTPCPSPCWSPKPTPCRSTIPHSPPKPTPCPSPVSPSVTLKVSFHHAGPLNPPHLSPKPTPCPSPRVPKCYPRGLIPPCWL